MNKKYQIFISSTFKDLEEERSRVIQTILELKHIPIGMEAFTATSEEQMNLIKKAIDLSDYYILIIKERYGSEYGNTGLSFTEIEYDYALSIDKPILSFIHSKTNSTENESLKRFVEKVRSNGKMASAPWTDGGDLAAKVSTSLSNEFLNNKQIGWVRADEPILAEDLASQLSTIGLSAFYTKRADFDKFRKSDNGHPLEKLRDYLSIAQKSIKVVVFTFAQGVVFENLCELFEEKLNSFVDFNIVISLLNPYDPLYYSSCCLTHNRKDKFDFLISEAKQSLILLREFRNSLQPQNKERFTVKFHNTALFSPAVLIDEDNDNGRLQIEIHPYKVVVEDRFAFEIKNGGNSVFYNRLKDSYNKLLSDATDIDKIAESKNL